MFQSSPSPKAGSYCFHYRPRRRVVVVSILSQPEGRELLSMEQMHVWLLSVSILSQPEGRELRADYHIRSGTIVVSILSQPEGRELLPAEL